MRVSFVVPGAPRGKGRPRFARRGNYVTTHTDKNTVSYENLIKFAASTAMCGGPPTDRPCELVVKIYVPIPKSFSKKKHAAATANELRPVTKPDVDNILKGVCDSLNGICWGDDRQCVFVLGSKYYSERPRLEVTVETIEEI